jgi:hypothetical protein
MKDPERLAKALSRIFKPTSAEQIYGWSSPALNVLDCVLSLNRRYDGFALPRVQRFAERYPTLSTLQGLRDLIARYRSPREFGRQELSYDDAARMDTLLRVTEYLLVVQREQSGRSERHRLTKWATSVRVSDYQKVGVRGFGLSGFQYLRMLFGAQTTKPDVHIQRFVSRVLGRKVRDVDALRLLEQAAALASVRLREADYAIWSRSARGASRCTQRARSSGRADCASSSNRASSAARH